MAFKVTKLFKRAQKTLCQPSSLSSSSGSPRFVGALQLAAALLHNPGKPVSVRPGWDRWETLLIFLIESSAHTNASGRRYAGHLHE